MVAGVSYVVALLDSDAARRPLKHTQARMAFITQIKTNAINKMDPGIEDRDSLEERMPSAEKCILNSHLKRKTGSMWVVRRVCCTTEMICFRSSISIQRLSFLL